MKPFKIGDRVTRRYKRDLCTRDGIVTEMLPYSDYPVKVVWDSGFYELFTVDGFAYAYDKSPGASRIEHATEVPKTDTEKD